MLAQAEEIASGKFHTILSDMSPKHTGIRDVDQAAITNVVSLAFQAADQLLLPGGNLIIKGFPSPDMEVLLSDKKSSFQKLKRTVLSSSRKSSNEFYIIGQSFKG